MSDSKNFKHHLLASTNEEAYFHAKNREAIDRLQKSSSSHLRLVVNNARGDEIIAGQAPPGKRERNKKAA